MSPRLEVDVVANTGPFSTGLKKATAKAQGFVARVNQIFAGIRTNAFQGATGGLNNLNAAMRRSTQTAMNFRTAMYSLGGAMAAVDFVRTVAQLDRLDRAFRAVFGVAEGAAQFQFVEEAADKLGIVVTDLADAYLNMNAAAQGTMMTTEQTRDVFLSVSGAMAVLGRSTADTRGALRAVEQMMSKGKVQAEELRGQLGERLPGAYIIAARAMGTTTQGLEDMLKKGEILAEDFLPKFAKELAKTFSPDKIGGINHLTAQWARLRNEVIGFYQLIAEEGGTEALGDFLAVLTNAIKDFSSSDEGIQFAKNLVNMLNQLAAVTQAAADGVRLLNEQIDFLAESKLAAAVGDLNEILSELVGFDILSKVDQSLFSFIEDAAKFGPAVIGMEVDEEGFEKSVSDASKKINPVITASVDANTEMAESKVNRVLNYPGGAKTTGVDAWGRTVTVSAKTKNAADTIETFWNQSIDKRQWTRVLEIKAEISDTDTRELIDKFIAENEIELSNFAQRAAFNLKDELKTLADEVGVGLDEIREKVRERLTSVLSLETITLGDFDFDITDKLDLNAATYKFEQQSSVVKDRIMDWVAELEALPYENIVKDLNALNLDLFEKKIIATQIAIRREMGLTFTEPLSESKNFFERLVDDAESAADSVISAFRKIATATVVAVEPDTNDFDEILERNAERRGDRFDNAFELVNANGANESLQRYLDALKMIEEKLQLVDFLTKSIDDVNANINIGATIDPQLLNFTEGAERTFDFLTKTKLAVQAVLELDGLPAEEEVKNIWDLAKEAFASIPLDFDTSGATASLDEVEAQARRIATSMGIFELGAGGIFNKLKPEAAEAAQLKQDTDTHDEEIAAELAKIRERMRDDAIEARAEEIARNTGLLKDENASISQFLDATAQNTSGIPSIGDGIDSLDRTTGNVHSAINDGTGRVVKSVDAAGNKIASAVGQITADIGAVFGSSGKGIFNSPDIQVGGSIFDMQAGVANPMAQAMIEFMQQAQAEADARKRAEAAAQELADAMQAAADAARAFHQSILDQIVDMENYLKALQMGLDKQFPSASQSQLATLVELMSGGDGTGGSASGSTEDRTTPMGIDDMGSPSSGLDTIGRRSDPEDAVGNSVLADFRRMLELQERVAAATEQTELNTRPESVADRIKPISRALAEERQRSDESSGGRGGGGGRRGGGGGGDEEESTSRRGGGMTPRERVSHLVQIEFHQVTDPIITQTMYDAIRQGLPNAVAIASSTTNFRAARRA